MRKKGFSLAELLIVLAIIGVLTALCIAAGRKSLQNAYNLHYYRSFNAITQAFEDYIYKRLHENFPDSQGVVTGTPYDSFCAHFASMTNENVLGEHGRVTVSSCKTYDTYFGQMEITIPKIKTNDDAGTTAKYTVLYHTGYETGSHSASGFAPVIFLQPSDAALYMLDNPRVLPAYVDDGLVGRVVVEDGTGTEPKTYSMKPIIPLSYRQAFCLSADTESKGSIFSTYPSFITSYCATSGVTPNGELKGMPVRLLKPGIIDKFKK